MRLLSFEKYFHVVLSSAISILFNTYHSDAMSMKCLFYSAKNDILSLGYVHEEIHIAEFTYQCTHPIEWELFYCVSFC